YVDHLKIWLRSSNRITVDIKANDKTPFVKGKIKLLEKDATIIGTIADQGKGLSRTEKKPNHQVKKEFLEHCKAQNIPIVLIKVYNNQKAYWLHMEKSICEIHLQKLKPNQKTITLCFDETHYIQNDYTEHCVAEFI